MVLTVDQIQQSLKENRLLRLPDFDINSKTSKFSLMTTIPSVIIIGIIMTIVALAFYKIRRLSVILAALSSPLATQAYVFEDQAPCPIPLECATGRRLDYLRHYINCYNSCDYNRYHSGIMVYVQK